MKLQAFLVGAFLVTTALVTGCSSSSSDDSTPSVFCSTSFGGSSLCYGYTNLTSDQQKSVSNACTQAPLSGKIVSSCPSGGLAGCCKYAAGGITTEECYYSAGDSGTGGDPATAGKQACSAVNGAWSTGM
jgi:hypothetical protein